MRMDNAAIAFDPPAESKFWDVAHQEEAAGNSLFSWLRCPIA